MITLPAGFNYSLLIGDFYAAAAPFVAVAALFVAYRIIIKVLGGVR